MNFAEPADNLSAVGTLSAIRPRIQNYRPSSRFQPMRGNPGIIQPTGPPALSSSYINTSTFAASVQSNALSVSVEGPSPIPFGLFFAISAWTGAMVFSILTQFAPYFLWKYNASSHGYDFDWVRCLWISAAASSLSFGLSFLEWYRRER